MKHKAEAAVDKSLGKGEVVSSILTGSTIKSMTCEAGADTRNRRTAHEHAGGRGKNPANGYDPISVARFWTKVDVRDESGQCWLWTGATMERKGDADSYGRIKIGGKSLAAHRVAYELFTGKPAGDRMILHSCDNKLCCNPMHLRAGTRHDNARDRRYEEGIERAIEAVGRGRIGRREATQIRAALAAGVPEQRLCDGLGVSMKVVADIRDGRTWKDAIPREDQILVLRAGLLGQLTHYKRYGRLKE